MDLFAQGRTSENAYIYIVLHYVILYYQYQDHDPLNLSLVDSYPVSI